MRSLKRDSLFLSLIQIYPLTESLRKSFLGHFLLICSALTAVKCTSLRSFPSANTTFISTPEGSGSELEWENRRPTFQSAASQLFQFFSSAAQIP